jgi:hypothetical protein
VTVNDRDGYGVPSNAAANSGEQIIVDFARESLLVALSDYIAKKVVKL